MNAVFRRIRFFYIIINAVLMRFFEIIVVKENILWYTVKNVFYTFKLIKCLEIYQ